MIEFLCSGATRRSALAAATALALFTGSAMGATLAEPPGKNALAGTGTGTPPWLLCAERDGALLKWCLLVDAEGRPVSKQPIDHVWSPQAGEENRGDAFGRLGHFRDGMLLFFNVTPGDYSTQRFGFIDTRGQVVVPARYRDAGPFSEGRARVCDERGCGYIDTGGREVIPLRREWVKARDFHDGRALVRGSGWTAGYAHTSRGPYHVNAPWSVIDRDGNLVMGPDQSALLAAAPSTGMPDYRWQPPTSHPFQVVGDFSGGVAPFTQPGSGGVGLVDTMGRIVAPALYSGVFSSLRGLEANAAYCVENKAGERGVLSRAGQFVGFKKLLNTRRRIDCSDFSALGEGHSLVGHDGSSYAILGPDLRVTMPWTGRFGQALQRTRMHERLIPIRLERKVVGRPDCPAYSYEDNYIDARGRFASGRRFDEAHDHGFSEGLAGARIRDAGNDPDNCRRMQGKLGFVDHSGEWAIAPRFDGLVTSFRDGRAVVHGEAAKSVLNGVWSADEMLIDREGRIRVRYSDLATPRPPR
ncbi:WG repeat-containing protein [Variovorax sp. KBW07]|uniref:WG repeat-containing protein n=1 Tax=Variovorax sp. KBW07 TaxID=2153358 RepID=UPI00162498B7|nr:WG repeat-containing protein [Variovorax sp. KBW07]